MEKAIYFAGGCFWGVERYFALIPGVLETGVGYANGNSADPSYEDVCRRETGHAETVKVIFDRNQLSLEDLLVLFYQVIDPVSVNRQGPDQGTQYRSGVYYVDESDEAVILESLKELQKSYDIPIAVEVKKLVNFYLAEDYHQRYLEKNPGGYCHIGYDLFEKARNAKPPRYQKKSSEGLKQELTALQYRVTQDKATEPAFGNEYYDNFREGIYADVTTGEPLFVSADKFESGCGWPSFSKPIYDSALEEVFDRSCGMMRTEVRSKTGDAHLGHVFADGPMEMGGLRYCINSAALRFIPKEDMEKEGYGDYLVYL